MRLEEIIDSINIDMRNHFENLTKGFKHRGLKGVEREGIVREFLTKYLPKVFGIATGEIVATDGTTSSQQDIIIYDSFRCPLLYNEKSTQVVYIEGVSVVIEVKSVLDSLEIEKSIINISSVKKMPKKAFMKQKSVVKSTVTELNEEKNYFNTMGILFAFSSKLSLNTVRKKIQEKYEKLNIPLNEQIDFVFIQDKGLLVHFNKNEKTINVTVELDTELCLIKKENCLLLFYLMLMERLNAIYTPPISVKDYAKFLYNVEY